MEMSHEAFDGLDEIEIVECERCGGEIHKEDLKSGRTICFECYSDEEE